jgi:hypothetical protein
MENPYCNCSLWNQKPALLTGGFFFFMEWSELTNPLGKLDTPSHRRPVARAAQTQSGDRLPGPAHRLEKQDHSRPDRR